MGINYVDICIGLNWGDEAKGKIISNLAKSNNKYDFVCRFNGGNNAGHTIYINNIKYKTHLIPTGVFHNIISIIGPDCVVNKESFINEITYLKNNGFNTDLVKISPRAHIIKNIHIEEDIKNYKSNGSTSRGIAPCYRDKYARIGTQVKDDDFFKDYLWDENLYGNILCEGAQGFWLDINMGNYPHVTSSVTLPYNACSLGFPTHLIRNIYGATKIYDTRVGVDPDFPESLLENDELLSIINEGKEYGTTTGKMRKVNWLNLNKLIDSINISGTNYVIMSKIDVLENVKLYKLLFNETIVEFTSMENMKSYINDVLLNKCNFIKKIIYSNNPEIMDNF